MPTAPTPTRARERAAPCSPTLAPPTSHATGLTNVYRDDEPGPCLTPAEALDQAPAVEQQRFKVPRILGED